MLVLPELSRNGRPLLGLHFELEFVLEQSQHVGHSLFFKTLCIVLTAEHLEEVLDDTCQVQQGLLRPRPIQNGPVEQQKEVS